MLGRILVNPRKSKDEGEKPFWISFADLMTAMMTLFLAAMAVTLVAVTREVAREKSEDDIRAGEILAICEQIKSEFDRHQFVDVNCADNRISFGEAGRFGHNEFRLPEAANEALATLVPVVLEAANSPLGEKWLKQVIIEGFTDTDGSYLYNLHLSLQRSEWVMCMLLDPTRNTALQLTDRQLQQVRDLFLAGGVSFNNAKHTKDASRRVELRLQFYGRDEKATSGPRPDFGGAVDDRCALT